MDDDASEADLKKKVVKFPKKSKRAEVATPAPAADDAPPTANPHIVEYLSKLLERAKRGEIQAIGFAGVTHEYVAIHSYHPGTHGDFLNDLVASAAFLSHELAAEALGLYTTVDDDEEEDETPGGGAA